MSDDELCAAPPQPPLVAAMFGASRRQTAPPPPPPPPPAASLPIEIERKVRPIELHFKYLMRLSDRSKPWSRKYEATEASARK